MKNFFDTLWNNLLKTPLREGLIFLYELTGNFGIAIILLTVIIRAILVPITIPAIKSAKKMQDLKPHLDKLKEKHGHDKNRLQQEQLKLYKEQGVNPAAGCLPYLVQFLVLIAMYGIFWDFITKGKVNGVQINMNFFGLNLAKPDKTYILPVVAGVTQFIMSLMMMPKEQPKTEIKKKTNDKKDDKKDNEDMAMAMNKQMMFLMPAMTVFIGISLPSGLALYWITTTVFSIIQQYFTTGLGGLEKYLLKLRKK